MMIQVCSWGSISEAIHILRQCLALGAQMNTFLGDCESIVYSIAKSYKKEGSFEELREFFWNNGFDPNSVDNQ